MTKCAYDFCENPVDNSMYCSEACSREDALLRDFVDDDAVVRDDMPLPYESPSFDVDDHCDCDLCAE